MNTHTSLFLRVDGSLLLVRDGATIEMALSPEQLLQLGIDCLRVAVALQPACVVEATAALEHTMIQIPDESAPCSTH